MVSSCAKGSWFSANEVKRLESKRLVFRYGGSVGPQDTEIRAS